MIFALYFCFPAVVLFSFGLLVWCLKNAISGFVPIRESLGYECVSSVLSNFFLLLISYR